MLWTTVLFLAALTQATDFAGEGMKALESQQYGLAAEHFAKAVEADPKDYAALFHLALANSLLGNEDKAIAGYRAVLEMKPGLYEAQVNLGVLLLGRKQATEAATLFEAAVTQKPQEFRPRFNLAEALLGAGEFAKAEEHYLAACKLDPKSAAAEAGLGRARARQNRLDEAGGSFRKAAELDAGYRDALLELGSLYEDGKQFEKAIEIYSQFPENAAARERMAVLLIRTGKPASAVPLLEDLLMKEPQDAGLRLTYGRVLRDLKKYAAAAAQFVRVVELKPDLVEAWGELAGVLILTENYPAGLAALDRLKALGAEAPGHLYLRAIILDKTKQLRPALESYRKFLEASQGKNPDEEFLARQRARIIQKELDRR
jgi:tetratricopeptide (TPR) repeat protein